MPQQFLIFGEGMTEWLTAVTGIAALFVSAWAVWLVQATLHETRRAVTSADEATNVARDIGRAQVRAYITVEPGVCQDIEIGKTPSVVLKIFNKGQSPAINVMHVNFLVLMPYPATVEKAPPIEGPELKGGAIIPAGTNIGSDVVFKKVFTGQNMESVISGNMRLVLIGFVKYLDVFEKEHMTRFCFTLSVTERQEDELYRTKWDLENFHNDMT